ncbi:MAG: efflux RND transporter periplasmic adaptor subunit [Gammaproteobacteria bacterium]|jgi:RND family efflux transporter MFP subunit|nr:MAG: efflux RND transporter periplasmic adaptor subunit [Gammaproteobacteria bacterium]
MRQTNNQIKERTMNWRSTVLVLAATGFLVTVMAYFSGLFTENAVNPGGIPAQLEGDRVTLVSEVVEVVEPVPGTVSATDETLVGSRILASITRMHVRSGDRVERGDLLVEFDDSAQRSVLAQRQQAEASQEAAFNEASLARDRAVKLFETGNLSRADYDQSLTAYRVQEAELERARRAVAEAQAQLDYTRITAPISGTVVDRYAEAGDTTTPGQALLRLFNPGRLRIEALLRESLINRVQQGQEINARIGALDLAVTVVVEEIVPTADPGSRSFLIKALLPQQADLYPGMFARLEIPVGERERLAVPEAAVVRTGQLTFVYVEGEDGSARRRAVRIGTTDEERVEVVSGLRAGETVIVPDGTPVAG